MTISLLFVNEWGVKCEEINCLSFDNLHFPKRMWTMTFKSLKLLFGNFCWAVYIYENDSLTLKFKNMLLKSTIQYPIQWRSITSWGRVHFHRRWRLNGKDEQPPPTSNKKQLGMNSTNIWPPPCKQSVEIQEQKQNKMMIILIAVSFWKTKQNKTEQQQQNKNKNKSKQTNELPCMSFDSSNESHSC